MWLIMVLLMISSATVFMKVSSLAWLTRIVLLPLSGASFLGPESAAAGLAGTADAWVGVGAAGAAWTGAGARGSKGTVPSGVSWKYSILTFLTPLKSLRTDSTDSLGWMRRTRSKGN